MQTTLGIVITIIINLDTVQFQNSMEFHIAVTHFHNSDAGLNDDHNFGELEYMLENERKKFREAKEKFESDLDNERKLRIEFENKLIKLKDEFSRKEVSISEMEFRINNLLHQNQDVLVENERLRN